MTSNAKKTFWCAAFVFCSAILSATRTSFPGFSNYVFIDLPEEYFLAQTNGDDSYLLQNKAAPVKTIVRIYGKGEFPSAQEALKKSLEKLSLDFAIDSFDWEGEKAALAIHNGMISGEKSFGYSAAVAIPEDKRIMTIISYCPDELKEACSEFMASVIDGLCINSESCFAPGLFTSFTFPSAGKKRSVKFSVDKKQISANLDESDEEAAQYLVEREYKVLSLYGKSSLWKEAWQRYYRMIFKDSAKRLKNISFEIFKSIYPSSLDETDFAQKILTWTQTLEYAREKNSADFTPPVQIFTGKGSDCDSRAMLIAVILQSVNMDSIIFVSAEFSHAVAGFVSTHPGFGFEANGKKYLTGDATISGATWGLLDAAMADESKWIPVILP
jgi:hypothetical protein